MSKNVLITGGAGFIAHHVIDVLLDRTDWNIITLDRLDYSGNLNRLFEILDNKPESPHKIFNQSQCRKFNIVGKEEIDNLTLAKMIAKAQNKELDYDMVDFHTSRPGHDLRYALSGDLMRSLGWEPKIALSQRIEEVTHWYLNNLRWLGE